MIDALKRNIEYMRISVTDRCNLRCMYCMPKEGVKWQPHEEILTYDEIIKLCRIFADLGISKIKLTGGEPLVRKDVHCLVKGLKQISGIDNVTLTTNGVRLEEQIEALVQSGLDAVNISIDSFDNDIFGQITGASDAGRVQAAIEKALNYDKLRVKLNCVPLKGINDQSLVSIAALAKDHRLSVRFIEMMPIGLGRQFEAFKEDELKFLLENAFGTLNYFDGKLGNGPCRYYTVEGFQGKIGFISAVSHRFCDKCNRIRLTADGFLKTCLQYDEGVWLKNLLRSGAGEAVLRQQIFEAVYHKPEGHRFGEKDVSYSAADGERSQTACSKVDDHKMFQIGG